MGYFLQAMLELFNDGQPVDLVTLQNRLKEKNVPPEVSSLEYVGNIVAEYQLCKYQILCKYRKRKGTLRELIRTTEAGHRKMQHMHKKTCGGHPC